MKWYLYSLASTESPYVRFVNDEGEVWNADSGGYADDTSWADSALFLEHNAVVGGWLVNVPPTLPAGYHTAVVYNAESAADTDEAVSAFRFNWRRGAVDAGRPPMTL